MSFRLLPLAATVLALTFVSSGAYAQTKKTKPNDTKMVPVFNKKSGKLEAVLLLEPAASVNGSGPRWQFGQTTLETTFGLQSGGSLALLCDRKNGPAPAIGQLASNCVLASLDNDKPGNVSRRTSAGVALNRDGNKVGLSIGSGHDILPAWLAPGPLGGAQYKQNDFSLLAEKSIGRDGFVSVGGTLARARLLPASDVPKFADHWNTRSLSIGGGYGAFGANIVGRVVNVPGESKVWEGLGLGLTWRTPWNGQLSVGADNVITRGKNPFTAKGLDSDEGTVPYVRYQQDL